MVTSMLILPLNLNTLRFSLFYTPQALPSPLLIQTEKQIKRLLASSAEI